MTLASWCGGLTVPGACRGMLGLTKEGTWQQLRGGWMLARGMGGGR